MSICERCECEMHGFDASFWHLCPLCRAKLEAQGADLKPYQVPTISEWCDPGAGESHRGARPFIRTHIECDCTQGGYEHQA